MLHYRLHTEADEPELIRLWSEHGGWDQVDADSWAHRLLHPPLGKATIVLGIEQDTGELLSQFAFIPSRVSINGEERSALRPFAPILAKSFRTGSLIRSANPMQHPIAAMYLFAVKALRARGDALIYMVPDPRWLRFFRLFPFLRCGSFPLWSLPFADQAAPLALPDGCTASPLTEWTDAVNILWEKAKHLHGCLVVRDGRTLPWKIGSGDYTITSVERAGEMIGLVASRQKGDRQWLICDLIAADTDTAMRATIAAAANAGWEAAKSAPAEQPIRKAAILATPVLQPALQQLGFVRDAYDFPMVVHRLDESLDKAVLAPERWYVSAND